MDAVHTGSGEVTDIGNKIKKFVGQKVEVNGGMSEENGVTTIGVMEYRALNDQEMSP